MWPWADYTHSIDFLLFRCFLPLHAMRCRQHPMRMDGGAAARVIVVWTNRHHVRIQFDVRTRSVHDAIFQRRNGCRKVAADGQQQHGGHGELSIHDASLAGLHLKGGLRRGCVPFWWPRTTDFCADVRKPLLEMRMINNRLSSIATRVFLCIAYRYRCAVERAGLSYSCILLREIISCLVCIGVRSINDRERVRIRWPTCNFYYCIIGRDDNTIFKKIFCCSV